MEKIFYTDKSAYPDSKSAVKRILSEYFHLKGVKISKNERGKPFLVNGGELSLFFSVSHTENRLFIAFSDENVGIDAENLARQTDYVSVIKRFAPEERMEILSPADFLRHWVAKESAIKWLGGSIARDLHKLRFVENRLFYGEIEIPAHLVFHSFDGYILAICSERDFTNAEWIAF